MPCLAPSRAWEQDGEAGQSPTLVGPTARETGQIANLSFFIGVVRGRWMIRGCARFRTRSLDFGLVPGVVEGPDRAADSEQSLEGKRG